MIMAHKVLGIIGSSTLIQIQGVLKNVPAKVDTGADSSSIWASHVKIDEEGRLHYVLFGEWSSLYDGTVRVTKAYKTVHVVSSNGIGETRYKILLSVTIEGRKLKTWFTLTDNRSERFFPVLIGRKTLHGKFLVDVSKHLVRKPKHVEPNHIQEFHDNPHKYIKAQ